MTIAEILNEEIKAKPFHESEKQAIIRIWTPIMERVYAQAIEDAAKVASKACRAGLGGDACGCDKQIKALLPKGA